MINDLAIEAVISFLKILYCYHTTLFVILQQQQLLLLAYYSL